MLRYETLLLTIPEITLDESSAIEAQLQKIVREHKGVLLSFERWGKMLLAYSVNKNDYGVYFLARFEIENEDATALLAAVRALFAIRLNDLVMRYLINRLDTKATLEYQRPDSLEDVPGKATDGFIKDHKLKVERADTSSDAMVASMIMNNDYQGKEVYGQES